MKSLASDNYSSVSPEIFDYLKDIVNQGHAKAYAADHITQKAADIVRAELALPDAAVHFTMTGTGANIMVMRQCLKPTHSLLLSKSSHFNTNETGAPEAIAGNKLIAVPHKNGKLDPATLELIVLQELDNLPHSPRPRMLSVAQSTEYGTVYTLEELKALKEFCVKYDLLFHVDMCRAYNAAIALGCELKDIIAAADPDIFSFGGTKNGLMMAEAVVICNTSLKEDFTLLQKQSMQLYSKMRYLSGQYIPFFEQKIWERNARAANDMCIYLAEKLRALPGIEFTMPVETNHIFCIVPKSIIPKLQEVTFFYVWDLDRSEIRLVTSFDTTKEDIDLFADALSELITQASAS